MKGYPLRLSDDPKDRAREGARRRGVSLAALIRLALTTYLEGQSGKRTA